MALPDNIRDFLQFIKITEPFLREIYLHLDGFIEFSSVHHFCVVLYE